MAPTVSVIIPTYNRADLIERAVRSVLDQTFTDIECLVVDDGSTDETVSIVRSIDDDRVTVIEHGENGGAAAARNAGIDASLGEYIAFLDDDDVWRPEKLAKQIDILESAPDSVGLVYCWMDYYDDDNSLVTAYRPELRGDIFLDVLDKQRIGNSSTLVAPAPVVNDVNGFDESILRGDDGDFIRRVALEYDVEYVSETLVDAYVDHGHRRITSQDEKGARNAIHDQKAKLRKFSTQFDEHPEKRAIVEALIARRYVQLGQYGDAGAHFTRAVRSYPFDSDVYKELYRGIRFRVRRASHGW
ncbi:glycosyltransferase family 2 protein [Haloarcula salina]|uniref:glycosyltransferase family 2 protein n=1 Tax=Haloarcula salina TaxID=1429914 RepID=UPI003C70450F